MPNTKEHSIEFQYNSQNVRNEFEHSPTRKRNYDTNEIEVIEDIEDEIP